MNTRIKDARIRKAARGYAVNSMDRKVTVSDVIDLGAEAMVYCRARDGYGSFALVLKATVADHRWYVVNETDTDDFHRNAKLFCTA